MHSYRALTIDTAAAVTRVTLARPDVHNAFDETLIAEITAAFNALGADPATRVIVLAGEGPSFCAGADLHWMRRMSGYDHADNLADARSLAAMLEAVATVRKPTIARVHGAAFGGGVGLVACCDIAFGVPEATFALSEARLGLIPATIGPYVVRAIGPRAAQRYMLTAERFAAAEALRIGLLHEVVAAPELDARIATVVRSLLAAGPQAQDAAKDLLRAIGNTPISEAVIEDTAQRIASVRAGDEAKEGVAAFLGKRPAAWVPPRD
ncbi:MAG: enoyl-CoA hydratase/isomerase family protein [Proteobacteria bacterium]|nr:enoyl-CoA hydratase/isomerase family protein [Pseudomonadota bacterium]